MRLSDVIKVWDVLHVKDTGDIGFCDLEKALDKTVGVENDIDPAPPLESGSYIGEFDPENRPRFSE